MQELREQSVESLRQKLLDLRGEQFNLRFQHKSGQLEQPHQLRRVRKDIARVKTVLTEKERQG